MRLALVLFGPLALAAGSLQTVLAADPPKDKSKAAVTEIAAADADYAYQGEYAGVAFRPAIGNQLCGLQVVALGDGKFDAVAYPGGLPGAGWDRQTKEKLSGKIDAGTLTLVSPERQFVIPAGGSSALVQGPNDQPLGRLAKVQRGSPTMGTPPPPGATVLFGGTPSEHLSGAKLTPDGLLKAGVLTKMPVEDFRLHLEFRTPYMPYARGQGRANSGVYIQQRYEVQILDSFGLEGIENECGGLYRQTRPDVNMCLPPLAWQTYDIYFTAARFEEDGKTRVSPARITVVQNGVPVHLHRDIANKTGGGKVEGPEPFPINLQDHGNPVTYRNIWIVPGQGDWAFGGAISSTGFVANGSYATSCCCRHTRRHLIFGRRRCR